jgi:uncharacterized protein with HEPN domain
MTGGRDYIDYIADMLGAGERAVRHLGAQPLPVFVTDELRVDAVVRALTVIGEACKRVPPVVRDRFPNIPWKLIAGMRDVLIHDYDRIDLPRVWDTVTAQLPPVLPALRSVHAILLAEETTPPEPA